MKRYAELGHVYRTEPCVEYPGRWIVYVEGEERSTHESLEQAFAVAQALDIESSICWEASENDPRIGEVWFTGYYCHGKFDAFGRYVPT